MTLQRDGSCSEGRAAATVRRFAALWPPLLLCTVVALAPEPAEAQDECGDGARVRIESASITESDPPQAPQRLNFRVFANCAPSGTTITVACCAVVADLSTATRGEDFDFGPELTVFAFDSATGQVGDSDLFSIDILADDVHESDEDIVLALLQATHETTGDPIPVNAAIQAPGTIVDGDSRNGYGVIFDNDPEPRASLRTSDTGEGVLGTRDLLFYATLDRPSELATSIDYRIGGGTAMEGEDYERPAAATGTLTFGPVRSPGAATAWETEKAVVVKVIGDTVSEENETVRVEFSGFQGITRERGEEMEAVTATILNDDHTLSISSPTIREGPAGMTATLEYAVRLIPASYEDVTVEFVLEGTAAEGEDYTLLPGSPISNPATPNEFTVPMGATRLDVPVSVIGDGMVEEDETLLITLSNPRGPPESTILFEEGQDIGAAAIRNDDHEIWVANAPDVYEGGDGETANLVYRVGMEPASTGDVTFSYSVSGGTAVAGEDYAAPSGTLVLERGDIASSIDVEIIGEDDVEEQDETVEVTLDGATGPEGSTFMIRSDMAMGIGAVGIGSVLDDEVPWFSISTDGVDETDAGVEGATFTVTLHPAADEPVSVSYGVTGGTATADEDYLPLAEGTLDFMAGDVSKTLELLVMGDGVPEPDETVTVTLSSPTTGTRLRQVSADLTIRNDDLPTLSISSPSVAEGNAGEATTLQFLVSLSERWGEQVTVDYAIADGTATLGEDYTATSLSGTLTLGPGVVESAVQVSVIGDGASEFDETVVVALSNPTSASLETVIGIGAILDDDQLFLSISSPSVDEGAAGEQTDLEFQVTLSAPAAREVSVAYAAAGGTATAGQDYQSVPTGMLFFAAGQTQRTVAVAVRGDGTAEADETVEVALSNSQGATIRQALGTGTIVSDDSPAFSIDSPMAIEPTGTQLSSLVYTVRLDPPSDRAVSVGYRVTGGTATPGDDYQPVAAGRLEFAAAERAKTIRVRVLSDGGFEERETVVMALSAPSIGTVIAAGRDVGMGVITEDTVSPVLSASSPRVQEGDEGDAPLVRFNVNLSRLLDYAVSVDYRVTSPDGIVLADMDGDGTPDELPSGTLTYGVGSTRLVILMHVAGNDTPEGSRRLVLTLANARLEDASQGGLAPDIRVESGTGVPGATATILDDDRVEIGPGFTYALAGFGRSAATGIVGALWDRAESHRTVGGRFLAMAGGKDIDISALASGDAGRAAREAAGLLGVKAVSPDSLPETLDGSQAEGGGFDAWRSHAGLPSTRSLVGGSRFALALDGDSGNLTFWGQGRSSSYSSDIDDETYSQFAMEGVMTAGYFGFDYRAREDVMYGIALSRSMGSASYNFERVSRGTGSAEFSLTAVTPYVHLISVTDFAVWAAAGFGQGTATVKDPAGEAETDISMLMAAIGLRTGATDAGSYEVAAKLDGFAAGLTAEGANGNKALEEIEATAYRARGAFEAVSRGVSQGGGASTARFDLGARFDGGSGESGIGADLGIKLGYANPNSGIELTGRGDVVLFHAQEGFSEWSAGLGLAYAPGDEGRGLQMSMGPSWNGSLPDLETAMEGQFNERQNHQSGAAVHGRLAYGMDALHGQALMTAYGEMEEGGERERHRRLRLGVEMRNRNAGTGGYRIEVYGQRAAAEGTPEHAVMLEARLEY